MDKYNFNHNNLNITLRLIYLSCSRKLVILKEAYLMEKNFKISTSAKKLLICGASLMMLASVGATAGSQLTNANASTHASVTVRPTTNNYKHLMNYLHWVQQYNHTHSTNWHSWHLSHMYLYMNDLTPAQINNIKHKLNLYHMWYYHNDKSMNTLMKKINTTTPTPINTKEPKAVINHTHKSYSTKQYKNIKHYLTWVNWYDAHHSHKINSWKLRHLNYYMSDLTNKQRTTFMAQAQKLDALHNAIIPKKNSHKHKTIRYSQIKRIHFNKKNKRNHNKKQSAVKKWLSKQQHFFNKLNK